MDQRDFHAFLLSDTPSEVLEHARLKGCLDPELMNLVGIPQDKIHHPEGHAYTHTLLVVDAAAKIAKREKLSHVDTVILRLAALLHDVGKAVTTEVHGDGRITAYDHPNQGVDIARRFLQRHGIESKYAVPILIMVKEHMVHVGFFTPDISTRVVKRIIRRISPVSVYMLSLLVEADYAGRGSASTGLPSRMGEIVYLADNIDIDLKPDPIVTGDMIQDVLGIPPSPMLGKIKDQLFTLQMSGDILDRYDGLLHLLLLRV